LEYHPKFIKDLVKPILEKKAKVVYGTRLNRMPHLKGEEANIYLSCIILVTGF